MIKNNINIFFVVEKIGPYHNARFNYLSKNNNFKINVIETNSNSKKYLWDEELHNNYQTYKLKNNFGFKKAQKYKSLSYEINRNLFKKKSSIIFITGWYDKSHHYIIHKSFF